MDKKHSVKVNMVDVIQTMVVETIGFIIEFSDAIMMMMTVVVSAIKNQALVHLRA